MYFIEKNGVFEYEIKVSSKENSFFIGTIRFGIETPNQFEKSLFYKIEGIEHLENNIKHNRSSGSHLSSMLSSEAMVRFSIQGFNKDKYISSLSDIEKKELSIKYTQCAENFIEKFCRKLT